MKRSRVDTYYLKGHRIEKDKECNSTTVYGNPMVFQGEVWQAGGKVQAEQYGERLSYIRNVRIQGDYKMETDENGILHYRFSSGLDVVESDGLCLYVRPDSKPDYRIISIKPYRPLRLEAERI